MLSKKTVMDLERVEYKRQQEEMKNVGSLPDFDTWRSLRDRSGDIFIKDQPVKRLEGNEALSFLEKNLFRYNSKTYDEKPLEIEIYEAQNPEIEVRQTMIKIADAIRSGRYAYRDIAIVCGSLEEYGEKISKAAERFGSNMHSSLCP